MYPQYGFSGSVSLAVTGLPSGVTASFSPNPVATGSSRLTLTANSTDALGLYTATITGTSGTSTASSTFTVGVYVPSFTLSDYSSVAIDQGTSGTSTVYVTSQYGFTGKALALSPPACPAARHRILRAESNIHRLERHDSYPPATRPPRERFPSP